MPKGIPANPIVCACGSWKGSPKDGLCRICRNRKLNTRYQFTPERDALLRAAYAQPTRQGLSAKLREFQRVTNISRGIVSRRARMLGLCFEVNRRAWTKEETSFLLDAAGELRMTEIAKKLGRSLFSVKLKLSRMGYSGRLSREGFTIEEMAAALGVSDKTVKVWTLRGWLKPFDGVYSAAAVRKFLRAHLQDLNLARVDQDWLKGELADMLRGGRNEEMDEAA